MVNPVAIAKYRNTMQKTPGVRAGWVRDNPRELE
jgi:hypothetical protein